LINIFLFKVCEHIIDKLSHLHNTHKKITMDPAATTDTAPAATITWPQHVAAYRAEHNCTYKDALKLASATYTKKPGSKPRAPRSDASKAKSILKKAQAKVTRLQAKADEAANPKPVVAPAAAAAEEPSTSVSISIV
jgi:hypothetical protein